MRLGLAQVVASTDPATNLDLVREQAVLARDRGAEVVVFPEATMASFATRSADLAEPLDGPFASGVRAAAQELNITLVVGMFTPGSDRVVPDGERRRRARNTLLVTGPGGEATYDKIHLFDAWGFEESRHVEPGRHPVVTRIAGTRVGLATCYDIRFAAQFTFLARLRAEVILVPASWANGPGKVEQWRRLCVARAMDTTCWVVGVGQADPATVGLEVRPGSPTGVGHSMVVDPLGEVVVEAGAAPELIVVDLDPGAVESARGQLPVLANGRFGISPPAARS